MNIKQVRVTNILLVSIMIFSGHLVYIWYIAVMHTSLELLNRQRLYLQHAYKLYNFIFWVYELVLLERLRTSFFSVPIEWLLNAAEHLLFGIIICIKVYIYTAVFSKENTWSRWRRGLVAFLLFNSIGVANEIFQNNIASRNLFTFIPDSIKDMQMNLFGAGVFALAVLYRIYWLKKREILQRKIC